MLKTSFLFPVKKQTALALYSKLDVLSNRAQQRAFTNNHERLTTQTKEERVVAMAHIQRIRGSGVASTNTLLAQESGPRRNGLFLQRAVVGSAETLLADRADEEDRRQVS